MPLAGISDLNVPGTYNGPAAAHFSSPAWNGYLSQTAAGLVRLDDAHGLSHVEAQGTGIVAVIDTGVDPDHPLLQGALVDGYDFLEQTPGIPSEWNALDPAERQDAIDDLTFAADQSTSGILEGLAVSRDTDTETGVEIILDQSYDVIVEQSYDVIVESGQLPAAFGHGTMVAGIVRDSAYNPTGADDWGAGRLDTRDAFANGLIGEWPSSCRPTGRPRLPLGCAGPFSSTARHFQMAAMNARLPCSCQLDSQPS